MGVIFGSARGSYGNTARGDQTGTGKEVSTQSGYTHSKGWRCFRAKDPEKRKKLAYAMKAFCANDLIGYSQPDRLALYNLIKSKNFDPAAVKEKTNCDCSSLVRVCCLYAGINVSNFTTADEPAALLRTGEFEEIPWKGVEYCETGLILDTKVKGHTVIVITGGSKAPAVSEPVKPVTYNLGDRTLKNGMSGEDVKELQSALIQLGYSCGKWGIDGEFGDATEMAVRAFQSDVQISVTGTADAATVAAINAKFSDDAETGTNVHIVGGNCYIRTEPSTNGSIIGVAYEGTSYLYANETSVDGWYKILNHSMTGWVSGKYGKQG